MLSLEYGTFLHFSCLFCDQGPGIYVVNLEIVFVVDIRDFFLSIFPKFIILDAAVMKFLVCKNYSPCNILQKHVLHVTSCYKSL